MVLGARTRWGWVGLVGVAVLAACSAFSGASEEPAPAGAADAGGSADASSTSSSSSGDSGVAPPPDGSSTGSPLPANNVGLWTFATQEACTAWDARHGTFTWVPEGHGSTGACRFCRTDNSAPAAEVVMPPVQATTTFAIQAWARSVDTGSGAGQIGIQARDATDFPVASGFAEVDPTPSWAPTTTKSLTVPADAGVQKVYAQLALLSSATGSCIDFDDVKISVTSQ